MRIVLTSAPGIGKTTAIRAVLKRLSGIRCAGFYTEEVRERGERKGFKICALDGREGMLASVTKKHGPRVGRYTVHVEEFEEIALGSLDPGRSPADLYVIDEIGKMELKSEKFRDLIADLFARSCHLLATVPKRGDGLVEEIKRRKDIELIEVTRENRDRLPEAVARKIIEAIKG